MRCVTWLAAGTAMVAMVGWAAGQELSREQIAQRVREAAAVKDDAERLKRFDALAAVLSEADEPVASEGWKITKSVSPVTEETTVELTLLATEKVDVGDGKMVRPTISVRAEKSQVLCVLHLGVESPRQRLWGGTSVAVRVDSLKARQFRTDTMPTDRTAMLIGDWEFFLQQSTCGNRMLVEFDTAKGGRAVASFDVSNSREAVAALQEAIGLTIASDCPRSPEEDAAWLGIEQFAASHSGAEMLAGTRNVVLCVADRFSFGAGDDSSWEPDVSINWRGLAAWLNANPTGRVRVTSFGMPQEDAPKGASAAGLRDWFTRQLLENKVDASRVEVTAASPELAAEVRRSPRYEHFVVSYGFELTFVTQP